MCFCAQAVLIPSFNSFPGNHEACWEQMMNRINMITVSQDICQMFTFPGEVSFF